MTLSTSSCRVSRWWPAPSARRIANSGPRAAVRASSRLAVFAQAIRRTTPTTARSTNSGRENCRRQCPRRPSPGLSSSFRFDGVLAGLLGMWAGTVLHGSETSPSSPLPVGQALTPGFSRTRGGSQLRLTIGLSSRFSKAGMAVGCIMTGAKTSGVMPTSTPKNSGGVTPTIVNGGPRETNRSSQGRAIAARIAVPSSRG